MRAAKKIRSQDGASITFALLLFLVCAVVSSVLIAAGSAAAGRASRAAEMDQRYYSVTSAADLLRSTLDGQSVEVQTGTVITEIRYSDSAAVTTEEEPLPTTIDGVSDGGTSRRTILADAACALAGVDAASFPVRRTLNLKASGGGLDAGALAALSVTVKQTLSENGTLTLDVTNTDRTKGTYALRLTFMADVSRTRDTHTDYGAPEFYGGAGASAYTITDVTTETVTTTLTWTLTGMEKLGSEA